MPVTATALRSGSPRPALLLAAALVAVVLFVGTTLSWQTVGLQTTREAKVVVIDRNTEHAARRHKESPRVRRRYRSGLCEGLEYYFSPSRGTVLVLCGLPDEMDGGVGLWGGIIWRVAENNGSVMLPIGEAYEATCMARHRAYWDHTIQRDGYFPLGNYPSVEGYLFGTFGR